MNTLILISMMCGVAERPTPPGNNKNARPPMIRKCESYYIECLDLEKQPHVFMKMNETEKVKLISKCILKER